MGFFFNHTLIPLQELEINGKQVTKDEDNTDYTQDDKDTNKEPEDLPEADPVNKDDTKTSTPSEEPEDYTIPDDANDTDDNTAENRPNDDTSGSEDDTTDYTADTGDETGTEDAEGSEDQNIDDTEPQSDDEIRQLEKEVFADLSPQQMEIKHKELKQQYLDMYEVTSNLIERINDVPRTEQNTKVLEFISIQLSDLREYISDYINSSYSQVSYMENAINYNKYLAILSGLNKILKELVDKTVDKDN